MSNLPYSQSKAGQSREKEIRDTLRSVGASAVGFMVDDDADQIVAQFRLRGREVTIPIQLGAYEKAWLKENPHNTRMRSTPAEHRQKARRQAEYAAWAILADWIKAQAAMMAVGFMDQDEAFLSHLRAPDGRRMIDVMSSGDHPLLPPPSREQ